MEYENYATFVSCVYLPDSGNEGLGFLNVVGVFHHIRNTVHNNKVGPGFSDNGLHTFKAFVDGSFQQAEENKGIVILHGNTRKAVHTPPHPRGIIRGLLGIYP